MNKIKMKGGAKMKKLTGIIIASLFVVLATANAAFAQGFDYAPFTAEVTSLVSDLTGPAVSILGVALALAGAVMLVKVGFRWIRSFIR